MLRNLLGVEQLGKSQKDENAMFASAEVGFNTGKVLYVGEELANKFSPGQRLYFGNTRELIRIDGKDVIVMKEDNVFAIVGD